MGLLTPLSEDERATFLVVALGDGALRALVGLLGTAPRGTRIDTLSVWQLADSLVDYYADDVEVADAVDRKLEKELGETALAEAVQVPGGIEAVKTLLLESRDALRDLAWALLRAGSEEAGAAAAALVQTIIAEFDEADKRAREAAEQEATPGPTQAELEMQRAAKEAARAQTQRERALQRVDDVKRRVSELEATLRETRRDLRTAEQERVRLATQHDRLAKEREGLRARLKSGTAAEVERLTAELESAERRARSSESELADLRAAEADLTARLRAREQAAPASSPEGAAEDAAAGPGAGWHLPVFTGEFYDSIRRWDRRIVRSAFEKAFRLAEDWRHPSLRAIPLEGLPDHYRIRVATDVRLIYRLDSNRVEVLSLIDREDLQRYIRNAKG